MLHDVKNIELLPERVTPRPKRMAAPDDDMLHEVKNIELLPESVNVENKESKKTAGPDDDTVQLDSASVLMLDIVNGEPVLCTG